MNIYKTSKSGCRVFRVWALFLAIFLSISLCFTLNPISKNARAYASDYQEETKVDADSADTEAETETSDNDSTQDLTEESHEIDSDNSVGSSIVDNEDIYPDEANIADDSDLLLSDEKDSDDDDTDKYENISDVDDVDIVDELISEITDTTETQIISEPYEGSVVDVETGEYTTLPTAPEDQISDDSRKYDQYDYSPKGTSSDLVNPSYIRCNYSYHLTDNQDGVFIDGFSYVSEYVFDDSVVDSQDVDKNESRRTLLIPSHINLKKVPSTIISSSITAESLPVLGISANAFENCDFIDQIIFDDATDSTLSYYEYLDIESNAFSGCINIQSIVSHRNILLGQECFCDCENLKSVIFNKNVAKIEDRVFANDTKLENVFWGNTYINQFFNFDNPEELNADNGMSFNFNSSFYTIGSRVFDGCSSIKQLIVPYSIKYVSDEAFAGADNLNQLTFSTNAKRIGARVMDIVAQDSENSVEQKIVFTNPDIDLPTNLFNIIDSVEADKNDSSSEVQENLSQNLINNYKVYVQSGSKVHLFCIENKIPVTEDIQFIMTCINNFSKRSEDIDTEKVVTDDQREHKSVDYSFGLGTEDDPYVIRDFKDLQSFASVVNSGKTDACAILANDIVVPKDSSGQPTSRDNWKPIGVNGWSGTLDGNRFTGDGLTQETHSDLQNDVMIGGTVFEIVLGVSTGALFTSLASSSSVIGLSVGGPIGLAVAAFTVAIIIAIGGNHIRDSYKKIDYPGGLVQKAEDGFKIKDLDLINVNFNVQSDSLGGYVSCVEGDGSIERCTITGSVSSKEVDDSAYVSAVVGSSNNGTLSMDTVVSDTSVSSTASDEKYVAGLLAHANSDVEISNSDSRGEITASASTKNEKVVGYVIEGVFAAIDFVSVLKVGLKTLKINKLTKQFIDLGVNYDVAQKLAKEITNLKESGKSLKEITLAQDKINGIISKINDPEMAKKVNLAFKNIFSDDPFLMNPKIWRATDYRSCTNITYNQMGKVQDAFEALDDASKTELKNAVNDAKDAIFPNCKKSADLLQNNIKAQINTTGDSVDLIQSVNKAAKESTDSFKGVKESYSYLDIKYRIDEYVDNLPPSSKRYEINIDDVAGDYVNSSKSYREYLKKNATDLSNKFSGHKTIHADNYEKFMSGTGNLYKCFDENFASKFDNFSWNSKLDDLFNQVDIRSYNGDEVFRATVQLDLDPNKTGIDRIVGIKTFDNINGISDLNVDDFYKYLEEYHGWATSDGKIDNDVIDDLCKIVKERRKSLKATNQFGTLVDDFNYLKIANQYKSINSIEDFITEIGSPSTLQKYFDDAFSQMQKGLQYVQNQTFLNVMDYYTGVSTISKSTWLFKFLGYTSSWVAPTVQNVRTLINEANSNKKRTTQISIPQNQSNIKTQTMASGQVSNSNDGSTVSNDVKSSSDSNTSTEDIVPSAGKYKEVVSTNDNTNSSVNQIVANMAEEIPQEAINGETMNNIADRPTIVQNSDSKTLFNEAKELLWGASNEFDEKDGHNLFGTTILKNYAGAAGCIAQTSGNCKVTITNTNSSVSVVGADSAASFIAIMDNEEVDFNSCTATSEATSVAYNSRSISLGSNDPSKNPNVAAYVATQKRGNFSAMGCVDASTKASYCNNGSAIGSKTGGYADINAYASTGYSFSEQSAYSSGLGGIIGRSQNDNSETIENSFVDGVVAGSTKNKGTISGTALNKINTDNVWYYANEDTQQEDDFATKIAPGKQDYESSEGVECITDSTVIQSGELAANLNEGLGDNVFGQNLGVTLVSSDQSSDNITLQNSSKSQRPLPYVLMPVFTYAESSDCTTLDGKSVSNSETAYDDDNATGENIYQYSNENSEDVDVANAEGDESQSVNTPGDNSGQESEVENHYINYPSSILNSEEFNFIDVTCNECVGFPTERTYLMKGSDFEAEFLPKAGKKISLILLDDKNITDSVQYNQEKQSYVFNFTGDGKNHKLIVNTEDDDFVNIPNLITDDNGKSYYEIKDIPTLSWYVNNFYDLMSQGKSVNAKLTDDIDMSYWKEQVGRSWAGLDEKCPWIISKNNDLNTIPDDTWEFDGQGFTISNLSGAPLINVTKNSYIHDLLVDSVSSADAAVVGTSLGSANFNNIYISNAVNVRAGLVYAATGSLVTDGYWITDSTLYTCKTDQACGVVAGFVYNEDSDVVIKNTYADIDIRGFHANSYLGGLIGKIDNSGVYDISKCQVNVDAYYNSTAGYSSAYIGGLIGCGEISYPVAVNINNCVVGGSINNETACFASGIGNGVIPNISNCVINFSEICAASGKDNSDHLVYSHYIADRVGVYNNLFINKSSACSYVDDNVTLIDWSGWNKRNVIVDSTSNSNNVFATGQATFTLCEGSDTFLQNIDDPDYETDSVPYVNVNFTINHPEYIVRFDGNGAKNANRKMDNVLMDKGTSANLTKNIYERDGYTFAGWGYSSDGKAYFADEQEFSVDKDKLESKLTLYAIWVKDGESVEDAQAFNEETSAEESEEVAQDENVQNADKEESASSTTDNDNLVGKVYKYTRLNDSNEVYYSNLTDENSFIITSSNTNDSYKLYETRTKVGYSGMAYIVPNPGYKLTSVEYEGLENTLTKSDDKPNIHPMLNLGPDAATVTFENLPAGDVAKLNVNTEIWGVTKPKQGDGSENNPFIVENKEELLYIANVVNCGVDGQPANPNIHVVIGQNIDMSGIDFPGIGTESNKFKGTFTGSFTNENGNTVNHLITGLSVSLFNYVDGANISNVDVYGTNIKGGILAYLIINSDVSYVDTFGSAIRASVGAAAAGIAVVARNDNVTYCNNYAEISCMSGDDAAAGGIIGYLNGSDKDFTYIAYCTNHGVIKSQDGDDNSYAGGIVGSICSDGKVTVYACQNFASIGGYMNEGGGIVGGIPNSNSALNLINYCINEGDVVGEHEDAGGIVGYITSAKNVIANSINKGAIEVKDDFAGGILGGMAFTDDTWIYNCISTASSIGFTSGRDNYSGWDYISSSTPKNVYSFPFNDEIYDDTNSWCYAFNGAHKHYKYSTDINDFRNGFVTYNINSVNGRDKYTDSTIGAFCQCIDREGFDVDNTPVPSAIKEDAQNFKVNKIDKQNMNGSSCTFYSNYNADELCYFDTDASSNSDIILSSNHCLPGQNLRFKVKSNIKQLIGDIVITDASGNIVQTIAGNKTTQEEMYTINVDKPGDYVIHSYTSELEYSEPKAASTINTGQEIEYLVTNNNELNWVANQVNSGENTSINFRLANNLDLYNERFESIGTEEHPFTGKFNGCAPSTNTACAISNLVNVSTDAPFGLFGYVDQATIENCNLSDVYVSGAALVFSATNSTIKNVSVSGTVDSYVYDTNAISAGIAGSVINGGLIEGCTNNASVAAITPNYNNYAAGIVAILNTDKCIISNCISNGSILAGIDTDYDTSKKSYAAGIVAAYAPWEKKRPQVVYTKIGITLYGCQVFGEINGWNCIAGGLIGAMALDIFGDKYEQQFADDTIWDHTIQNCYNFAIVGSRNYCVSIAGGLIGTISGDNAHRINILSCATCTETVFACSAKLDKYAGNFVGLISSVNNILVTNSWFYSAKVYSKGNSAGQGLLIGTDNSGKDIRFNNVFVAKYEDLGVIGNASSQSIDGCELINKTIITLDYLVNKLNTGFYNNSDYYGNILKYTKNAYTYPIIETQKLNIPSFTFQCDIQETGEGSQYNPYIISKARHLYELQILGGQYVKVVSDIDMSGMPQFTGLGTSKNPFSGSFVGCVEDESGNVNISTISGLRTSLFNSIQRASEHFTLDGLVVSRNVENTWIEGLNFTDFNVEDAVLSKEASCVTVCAVNIGSESNKNGIVSSDNIAGAVISKLGEKSIIYGCMNYCNVYASGDGVSAGIIGSISGKDVVVQSCANYGQVNAEGENSCAAGVVGLVGGDFIDSDSDSTIYLNYCFNLNTVYGNNNMSSGIISYIDSNNGNDEIFINQCGNRASIGKSDDGKHVSNTAAGILCKIDNKNTKIEVNNSYSCGNIFSQGSDGYSAGVVAVAKSFSDFNVNDCFVFIDNIVSDNVNNSDKCAYIVGELSYNSMSLNNVYANDCGITTVAQSNDENIISGEVNIMTKEQFSSGEVTYLLNSRHSNNKEIIFDRTFKAMFNDIATEWDEDREENYGETASSDVFYQVIDNDYFADVENAPDLVTGVPVYKVENNGLQYSNYADGKKKVIDEQQVVDSGTNVNLTSPYVKFTGLVNGSISLLGMTSSNGEEKFINVEKDKKYTITITPSENFVSSDIVVNGQHTVLNGETSFDFVAIDGLNTVNVGFKESTATTPSVHDGKQKFVNWNNTTFEPWTSTTDLPKTSGSYYLVDNVNLTDEWVIPEGENIYISLEGNAIIQNKSECSVIRIQSGAHLEIFDYNTSNSKCHYFTYDTDSSGMQISGWKYTGTGPAKNKLGKNEKSINGGIITGSKGANGSGITLEGGGCILHQGYIVGNESTVSAGGVNNHGTFRNYHGSIVGNYGKYTGAFVNHSGAIFSNEYEVAHNVADVICGGVRNAGTAYVKGFGAPLDNVVTNNGVPYYSDFSFSLNYSNPSADEGSDKITMGCRLNVTGKIVNPRISYFSIASATNIIMFGFVLTKGLKTYNGSTSVDQPHTAIANSSYSIRIGSGGELELYAKASAR